jgi:hypothetical protein
MSIEDWIKNTKYFIVRQKLNFSPTKFTVQKIRKHKHAFKDWKTEEWQGPSTKGLWESLFWWFL